MQDMTPVPYGAFYAVFRDTTADDGLMVRPVVGFKPAPPGGGAAVIGGPEGTQYFPGPPRPANPGAIGIPVIVTRRGELRAPNTALPAPTSADDMLDSAPANVGLAEGVMPAPEYLGIVQAHENAADVFAAHVEAANGHKAAVEAHNAAQRQRAEVPAREVEAEVSGPQTAVQPPVPADVDALLSRAREMTADHETTSEGSQ